MGRSKQLLPLGQSTLLETVIDKVRRSQVREMVVVLGAGAEEIRSQIRFDGIRVVLNQDFGKGMGTSLARGIGAVESDAALVVLADQPFVETATLDRLIGAYRAKNPQIVIPLFRGFRGNPVLLDRSVFPEIRGLDGDIGCRAIFGGHSENILKVPVDDAGVLLDIDTREDFEKLGRGRVPLGAPVELSGRVWDARPRLVIVGSEKTAVTLAAVAKLMNFLVIMVDPFVTREEAPGADFVIHELDFSKLPAAATSVVIASGGRFDEEAVEQALSSRAGYIALVANRKRSQEVLSRVAARGIDPGAVRTKAGIDIGAEGPEEIALSVMAEIIAERHRSR